MADEKNSEGGPIQPSQKITLVVTGEMKPKIRVEPNTRVEVIEIGFQDTDGARNDDIVLASLCGYGSTYCVALVEY